MQTNEIAEQAAVAAAEKWLALTDVGDSPESWNQAATQLFKSAVTPEQWKTSLDSAQGLVGRPLSRELRSKEYKEEMPGLPDGEYVVLEYATSLEKKRNGTETVFLAKDSDGEWRVAGYFVK